MYGKLFVAGMTHHHIHLGFNCSNLPFNCNHDHDRLFIGNRVHPRYQERPADLTPPRKYVRALRSSHHSRIVRSSALIDCMTGGQ